MILKVGKSNSKQAVRALRLLLDQKLGDIYDSGTEWRVKYFQQEHGLEVDGEAGPLTLEALCSTLPDVEYMDYSGSKYVKAVQALVSTAIDGKYGKNTRANVIALQTTSRLDITGNVGLAEWKTMFDVPLTPVTEPKPDIQTPQIEKDEVPVDYKQGDKRWSSVPYTVTGDKKQTIGTSGCGPTSMADIMALWIDGKITPKGMCDWSLKHGFRTPNQGTSWGFFKAVASSFGYSKFVQTKSLATLRSALKEGAFAVASMGPGYWTSGGHYICIVRTDEKYVYANDPASNVHKKQLLGDFEQERKQFFIFYKPKSKGE